MRGEPSGPLAKLAKASRLSAEAARLFVEAAEEFTRAHSEPPPPSEPPELTEVDIARARRALRKVGILR